LARRNKIAGNSSSYWTDLEMFTEDPATELLKTEDERISPYTASYFSSTESLSNWEYYVPGAADEEPAAANARYPAYSVKLGAGYRCAPDW
jgi:hypothetical protein